MYQQAARACSWTQTFGAWRPHGQALCSKWLTPLCHRGKLWHITLAFFYVFVEANAARPKNCKIGLICFLAGRHESWLQFYSFVRFSFAYVFSFHYLLFRFLCCHLVAVIFVLLVPVKWLVRKTVLCTSQVISQSDRLQNDLWCVECDVKPYYSSTYTCPRQM